MKLLSHLAPRAGAGEAFAERVRALGARLRAEAGELAVTGMLRLADDPFGRRTPYGAAIEIAGAGATPERLGALLTGLGAELDAVAHADLSTALCGADHVFVGPSRSPVRYQYLMRRRAPWSHAGYLERYREIHSRFGLATPGIEGYVQFHVDLEASRQVAAAAGLGCWSVDSVSELHLESAAVFVDALARKGFGAEAVADEELFVDRARSFDFCCRVERAGP